MADDVDLGDLRPARDLRAVQRARGARIGGRHVERRQRVADACPAPERSKTSGSGARLGAPADPGAAAAFSVEAPTLMRPSPRAPRRGASSSARVVHLGGRDEEAAGGPPRSKRESGTPPRIFRAASAREQRRRVDRAPRRANSLNVGPAKAGCGSPGSSRSRPSGTPPSRGTGARSRAGPPCRAATCDVATRGRRGPGSCRCSRSPSRAGCAARASRASGRRRAGPSASVVCPTRRPGIWRLLASRHARKPTSGPPMCIGTPNEAASPHAMSMPPRRRAARAARARTSRSRRRSRAPPSRAPRRPSRAPVLDDAEEVRGLDGDGERRLVDGGRERRRVRRAVLRRAGPRRS